MYQGGCYPGNFWEWNWCCWSQNGVWHNLFSSGADGVTNEREALELAETSEKSAELIDLTNDEQIKQFQKNYNVYIVLAIARCLNTELDYELELFCFGCGCKFIVDEYTPCSEDDIYCDECYNIGFCSCCEEFVGEDQIIHIDDKAIIEYLGYDFACEDCYEHAKEQIHQEDLKVLYFESWLTGKPDMFSDELREIWE